MGCAEGRGHLLKKSRDAALVQTKRFCSRSLLSFTVSVLQCQSPTVHAAFPVVPSSSSSSSDAHDSSLPSDSSSNARGRRPPHPPLAWTFLLLVGPPPTPPGYGPRDNASYAAGSAARTASRRVPLAVVTVAGTYPGSDTPSTRTCARATYHNPSDVCRACRPASSTATIPPTHSAGVGSGNRCGVSEGATSNSGDDHNHVPRDSPVRQSCAAAPGGSLYPPGVNPPEKGRRGRRGPEHPPLSPSSAPSGRLLGESPTCTRMRAGANVGFPRWKYARNGAIHTACTTANGAFSRNTT